MSEGIKLPFKIVATNAKRIADALVSSCHSLVIVGSVRRCTQQCGDIELLAVTKKGADLFGNENGWPLIDDAIEVMIGSKMISKAIKDGPRQKQFELPIAIKLDLFIVPEDEWAVALALRTGPKEYSRALVTERNRGGLLKNGCVVRHGKVWRKNIDGDPTGEPLPVESEVDFLDRYCGGYVLPGHRRFEFNPNKRG